MPDQRDILWGVPEGEAKFETPDGVLDSSGFDPKSNLYDTTARPKLQSGDWQVRPPDLKPRGRP